MVRQSELEGALLLGRMVRTASDSFLVRRLTRHAADEARHAAISADAIAEAGLPTIRIFRSYQSLYGDHGGMPVGMREVLAFTQIFERRVHKRFTSELHQSDLPAPARKAFEIMIADESDHLEWVLDWLGTQADSEPLLRKFNRSTSQFIRRCFPTKTACGKWPDSVKNLNPDLDYGHSHALWRRLPARMGQSASVPSFGLHPVADWSGACPLHVVSPGTPGLSPWTDGLDRCDGFFDLERIASASVSCGADRHVVSENPRLAIHDLLRLRTRRRGPLRRRRL